MAEVERNTNMLRPRVVKEPEMIPRPSRMRKPWDILDMFFLTFLVFWDVLYLAFATYYMGGVPSFPPKGIDAQVYWAFFTVVNLLVITFWVITSWMVSWRRTLQ